MVEDRADLDRAGSATAREVYPELSPDTLAKIQVGLDELDAGLGIKVDNLFWQDMRRQVREPKAGARTDHLPGGSARHSGPSGLRPRSGDARAR